MTYISWFSDFSLLKRKKNASEWKFWMDARRPIPQLWLRFGGGVGGDVVRRMGTQQRQVSGNFTGKQLRSEQLSLTQTPMLRN